VGAFLNKCTAEEIVLKYLTLELADVCAVIAHYLSNRPAVDAYLSERAAEARAIRDGIEQRSPSAERLAS
jgi:hypothetical protein